VDRLAAHIDFFPTVAEIAAAKLDDEVRAHVEGRSLVPLLRDPKAEWPDRILFTHVGRWPKGAKPAPRPASPTPLSAVPPIIIGGPSSSPKPAKGRS
jgi:hypothetical protein